MAANSGSVRAGRAFIELFADSTALVRGLRSAESKLRSFGAGIRNIGAGLMAIGVAGVTPLLAMTKSFSDYGAELDRVSQKTGMSVNQLGRLRYVAEQADVDFAGLTKGIKFMQKNIDKAGQGSKASVDQLARLGLTVDDLAGKSPQEQLAILSDRIGGIADPAKRTALAMGIFGRAGSELVPLFRMGGDQIRALGDEAEKLGIVMSEKDVKAAEEVHRALKTLWAVITAVKNAIGAALAPIVKDFADKLIVLLAGLKRWIDRNPQVVRTALKIAAAVVVAGAALVAFGMAFILLAKVIGAVMTVWSVLTGLFSIFSALVTAILSPLGLFLAALAAVGVYIVTVSGAGGKALGWLGNKFSELKQDAMAAWQGISDALAAGDIGLAARILWLTLKMEWLKGIQPLKDAWHTFQKAFLDVGIDAWYNLLSNLVQIWAILKSLWVRVISFLADQFAGFMSRMKRGWIRVQTDIAVAMVEIGNLGLTDEEREATKKSLREREAREVGAVDTQETATRKGIVTTRDAELGAITANENAALANIGQNWEDMKAGNEAQFANTINATQAEVDKAKAEWAAAIKKAKEERAAMPDKQEAPGAPTLPDIDVEVNKAKVGVAGTFSATAAERMGAGGISDRLVKANELTAKNTQEIADNTEEGAEFE